MVFAFREVRSRLSMETRLPSARSEVEPWGGREGREDPMIDPADLGYLLRRHGRWLLALPIGAGLAAVVVSFLSVPLYRSTTTLYIDPHFDHILRMERMEQASFDDLDSLASLEEFVVSNTVLLRVADRLRLREEPGFWASGPLSRLPWPVEIPANDELVKRLRDERVWAKLVRNTRLLEIGALDPDAERARRMVEALAEEFERLFAERRAEEAGRALASLERQAGEAHRNALRAEERLKAFREEHAGLPIEQDSPLFTERLAQLGGELNAATGRRIQLESQVTALRELDPETDPLPIFEVMGREGFGHVSDLLSARAAAQARLATARRQYGESNATFLAAADEARLAEEQVIGLARDLRAGAESEWKAARQAEDDLGAALRALQADQVRIKEVGSRFRAIQEEVEKEWGVHRRFQERLSEGILGAELATNIATMVAEPMASTRKAFPKRSVHLLGGGFVGALVALGWLGWKWMQGLPWSGRRQVEARFGRPVLADLSPRRPGFWAECLGWEGPTALEARERESALAEALFELGAARARVIVLGAAGGLREGCGGPDVVGELAELSARHGGSTLLVRLVNGDGEGAGENLQPVAGELPGLFTVTVPARLLLAPDVATGLVRHCRERFARSFLDATGLGGRGAVSQLIPAVDAAVMCVPLEDQGRAELEEAVAGWSRPGWPPVSFLLTGGEPAKRDGARARRFAWRQAVSGGDWGTFLRALR
jgi:uncharacterized protein involved in exopolysaccharide biosynthesis